ncbi:MAG: hypothetical protein ABSH34_22985 [Verrucomicrobiota bacterium]|jgi:hypothetical protein
MIQKHPGRPRLGTEHAKGVFFAARFNKAEAARLNAAIRLSGQKKSTWIRNTLLFAASDASGD